MRRLTWVTASAAVMALLVAPAAAADVVTPTLSVTGSGAAFVAPDVADLSVSVSRTAASSRQALSAANNGIDTVVRSIHAIGIPMGDVQTEGISVSQVTVRVGMHKLQEWNASEMLTIHVTNIRNVGAVIDTITRAGASTVDGPTFSFSSPSVGKVAATRAAIADARTRAADAASVLGYRITGLRSVQLDPMAQIALPAGAQAAPSSPTGTRTTVHPGSQEVDAQVVVVYTIAPA